VDISAGLTDNKWTWFWFGAQWEHEGCRDRRRREVRNREVWKGEVNEKYLLQSKFVV
jgi:hypothetical protein